MIENKKLFENVTSREKQMLNPMFHLISNVHYFNGFIISVLITRIFNIGSLRQMMTCSMFPLKSITDWSKTNEKEEKLC